MRFLTFSFIVFLFCTGRAQSYEDDLWKDLKTIYIETNIHLDSCHQTIESYVFHNLFAYEVVNYDASDYKKLLQRQRVQSYSEEVEGLRNQLSSFSLAVELYYRGTWDKDSIRISKSSLHAIRTSLGEQSDLDMSKIQKAFREHLTSEDLAHPLYRFMSLLVMINVPPVSGNDLTRATAPQTEEVAPSDILSIRLDSADGLFCNGRPVNTEELLEFARGHMHSKADRCVIVFLYATDSSFDLYMTIFNGLKQINEELRDSMAYALFGVPYASLEGENKSRVQAKYPFNITEIEE